MKPIPFHTTQWETLPVTEHPGESGWARWRTMQYESFRVRLVEYSANYVADHWCAKGHILFCLDGEMESQLADGRSFTLTTGMSYQVSDNASSHRSTSKGGVTLLIIDGEFLKHQVLPLNPWKM